MTYQGGVKQVMFRIIINMFHHAFFIQKLMI